MINGSCCMGPKKVDLLETWTNINLSPQMADMNWGWKLGHAQKAEGDVSSVKHGASTADTLVVACRPPWTLRRPVDPLKTNQVYLRGLWGSLRLIKWTFDAGIQASIQNDWTETSMVSWHTVEKALGHVCGKNIQQTGHVVRIHICVDNTAIIHINSKHFQIVTDFLSLLYHLK